MIAAPKMAKMYVKKNMTTNVQNKVEAESPKPRISLHASRKTGLVRTTRASLNMRTARSTVSGRRALPAASKPNTRDKRGISQVDKMPTATRNASKKFHLLSAEVGQNLWVPFTMTFMSSSRVNNAVNPCSATSKMVSKRTPPNPGSHSACASSPIATQFNTMIELKKIEKLLVLTQECAIAVGLSDEALRRSLPSCFVVIACLLALLAGTSLVLLQSPGSPDCWL
mmetsp:Transcript_49424/g.105669  ORF Transcript_49424/g.105669 Transcript_49424/m.105669 type:complete len:226 (-) Transcript_49424:412-1089(-)